MNSTIVRYLALPILSVGIIGGAALGLAGVASAAQGSATGSAGVAAPQVHANPAPEAVPGYQWHRHHYTLIDPSNAAVMPPLAH